MLRCITDTQPKIVRKRSFVGRSSRCVWWWL